MSLIHNSRLEGAAQLRCCPIPHRPLSVIGVGESCWIFVVPRRALCFCWLCLWGPPAPIRATTVPWSPLHLRLSIRFGPGFSFVNGLDPAQLFPFPLDAFQQNALAAINQGQSLVVSAPTGSGKTLIGEYAIHRAMAHGRRVFYTTPLKALSNQKLRDFRQQFGIKQVGLLTGDLSLNREAPVVVMTTEIFRNMLYGQSELEDPLAGVEAVVLDECHYMNDSQRGTVWEESIIHCPASIQLLALSATVANGDQLKDWIQQVHGPCALIHSVHRPVPLSHSFCSAKGLHPLLNEAGDGLHPSCKVWRPPKGYRRRGFTAKPSQPEAPRLSFVVQQLAERDMLPAIIFIFSRRGCDRGVAELARMSSLLTPEQQQRLKARLERFRQQMPDGVRGDGHADALLRGIASHHAGVLPAWKELVEELFQAGLLKVVLATETLAAGINMPARSTVICALSKRTETGHRPLMASEFLQMAGRAGRRGLDQRGHVVTVQGRFEGVREAGQLATSPADPLVSQFTPSYSMVLNLLQRYSLDEAQELVERSFGRYLASLGLVDEQQAIDKLAAQVKVMSQDLASVPWQNLDSYEKERAKLREEQRLLRTLRQQAAETVAHELTLALQFASQGTIITVKSPHLEFSPAAAVLVDKCPGPGQFPLLLCLTEGNIWLLLPCRDVVAFHGELSCLTVSAVAIPSLCKAGERRHGDESSEGLALAVAAMTQRHDLRTARYDLAAEVQDQAQRVAAQEKQLNGHPAHAWRDRKRLKQKRHRLETVTQEWEDRCRQLNDRIGRHWRIVLSLIDILRHFTCLQELEITPTGRVVSAMRGDNELWLGLALLSGHLDNLPAAELAATMEAISTEVSRNDLWSAYPPPPLVMEALMNLRGLGRELDHQQQNHGITTPIWWEPELTGLVASWARGSSWDGLIAKTSLDEGDVVRVLRRTMDVLAQIPHCPGLSEPLRRNARRAHTALNRFPVREADAIAVEEHVTTPDVPTVDPGSA